MIPNLLSVPGMVPEAFHVPEDGPLTRHERVRTEVEGSAGRPLLAACWAHERAAGYLRHGLPPLPRPD
jgi:hypothetical protein